MIDPHCDICIGFIKFNQFKLDKIMPSNSVGSKCFLARATSCAIDAAFRLPDLLTTGIGLPSTFKSSSLNIHVNSVELNNSGVLSLLFLEPKAVGWTS